ncbi:MAG: MFS transporter [Caldilineaceae bacterium]|nr:MFS transporter [Caldilineaceae bacterium]HRJ44813.1 MFS transporter [Caldilineaceae bacterium]
MPAFSRRYWTVWAATLVFFGAFYTLIVPLPLYLDQIGLPDWQIGLILGAFGIASLLGRPLAGALSDSLGSKPVILFGTASLLVGALGVSQTVWPPALFGLRILQTAGYVAFTTASTALIAQLAPVARRGAAIALFGAAANVAITLTPAIVSAGLDLLTLRGAFWLCGGLALAAGLLVWTAIPNEPSSSRRRLAMWEVLTPPAPLRGPMLTTALFGIAFGAFYSFLPLLAERRGLEPVGLAYTVYGGSIIVARLLTANLLDRPDRTAVLAPSLLIATSGLLGFAFADNWTLLLVSAALMAAGSGVAHPALIALCVDRLPDNERGRATASFYLAFDLGIGMGNWLLGSVLGSFGLLWMYLLAAAISLVGVGSTGLARGKVLRGM